MRNQFIYRPIPTNKTLNKLAAIYNCWMQGGCLECNWVRHEIFKYTELIKQFDIPTIEDMIKNLHIIVVRK